VALFVSVPKCWKSTWNYGDC